MRDLIVSLLQEPIAWQDPAANRAHFGQQMAAHAQGSDLIVLPEMFTTGFSQQSVQHAETMDGPTVDWLRQQAEVMQAAVAGSVVIRDGQSVFNRLLWARPDGEVIHYDKRHLFSFAGEHNVYHGGESRVVIDCQGWRCCPQICYDLRFPVWSRNRQDYDLLIYVANWPKARVDHWSALLRARAIENLSYTVGVNRVGDDGDGVPYNGQSIVLSPKGKPMVEPGTRAGCYTVTLDGDELVRYREKFGALNDADTFVIK